MGEGQRLPRDKPRRGQWRRLSIRLLVVVVALALVVAASVVLGLRVGAVRQMILTRVAEVVENRTGIRLDARDFKLGLSNGVVEIFDLQLAVSEEDGASPFLAVPGVRGVVRWRTLLGGTPTIESLVVENPRFDLSAPLPSFENGPDDRDESSFPALDVLDFDLTGGRVIGPSAPDSADVWLDAWRAEEIRIRGSLRSGQVRVEEASARWIADSHRRAPLDVLVDLTASGDVDSGSFAVDSLQVRGDGVTLDGHGGFEASTAEARLAFETSVEPARLFPDLTSGGHLTANGDIRLETSPEPTLSGVLQIDSTDIPGELAHPWVGPEAAGVIDAAGTRLDAALDLDLRLALTMDATARSRDKVLGSTKLVWRRGSEPLLTASVRSLDSGEGVNLAFAGELTPSAPGHRRVSGELRAPTFIDVLEGTLRSVRVDVVEPDPAKAAERIGIDPSFIPEWWPRGSVSASLDADGPVTNPRLRLDARWDHEDGELLAVISARTLDDPSLRLRYEVSLLPGTSGRRELSGELLAPGWNKIAEGEIRDGRLVMELPELATVKGELARRLPGLLPEGFVPEGIPKNLLRGDLSALAEVSGPVTNLRLRLDARWDHEDGEPVAVISARTLDDPSLRLRYEVSLLPEMPGRRKLSGELLAPGWSKIAEGEIRDGRLVMELPEIATVEKELARRFPGLLPEGFVPEGIPKNLLRGDLSALADVSGPLLSPDVDLQADWTPAAGETVHIGIRGRPSGEFPFLQSGHAALSLENLGLSRFDPTEPPSVAGSVDASLNLDTSTAGIAASLHVDGRELSYGDLASMSRLRLDATSDGESIELRELSGTLATGMPGLQVEGEFNGQGRSDIAWPPRHAEARLAITDPVAGIDRIDLMVRLEDGVLHIERFDIESQGNVATIRGSIPLSTPAAELATEPMSLSVANLDLRTVTGLFDTGDEALPLHGVLNGSLTFDPADPVSAVGSLAVSGIAVGVEGEAPLELGQTIRIEMGDGRIVLPPTRLEPGGKLIRGDVPLDIAATVVLARDWRPGDDLVKVVESVDLDVDGTVDASLLNPFLAGGAATGEVAVKLTARGAPETLTANVSIRGPDARVIYIRPYPTKLEALEVDLVARRGEVVLERATARLNDGDAEMTGTVDAEEGLRADLKLDGARYRLDFGIVVSLRGDLRLEWPVRGRRRIGGTLVIERAVLRRNIALGRDVLGMLFDLKPETGGTVQLDTIDLDLLVSTDEGVLIKNNVADVQADWGRVEITGTAARPLLDGRVDVQPGGIITAFGQALRIDEGSFEWSGEPVMEPRMVFETTSSSEDPSILKSWRNEFYTPADLGPGRGGTLDFWSSGGQTGGGGGWEQLAAGTLTQATSAVRTQLTFEPLPLFGETDTQARFTLVSDLSPQLSFIASTNPRETEAQTYILDIHRMPVLQSLRAQVFTNDEKNAGLTLQQTLRLGARPATDTQHPTLQSTTVDTSGGVSKRRIRRAIDFRKADPFPSGAALDVEVDVIDLMRKRGYPAATVKVGVEPVADDRVDLVVTVRAGEPVGFVFEGDELPSRIRKSIAAGYRPNELGEDDALDEIQSETVTALLGQGYLKPRVDVEALPTDPADPDAMAMVRVIVDGGRRVDLTEVVVEGLPDEEAARIAGLFRSTLSRIRLATEFPASDALLLRTLERIGYPQARIAGRELSELGERLTVRIEPGERRHVVSVEIVGLAEADRARFAETLEVGEGDPADTDRIGLAARAIERALRDRGHAEAEVRVRAKPLSEDRPLEVALRYDVDPGPDYWIGEVRFEGLNASRKRWVERVAGLETGQVFRRRDVADARARLFRTGVFQRIGTSTEEKPGDTASPESAGAATVVTFEVEEARRWQLAYGGRWEQEKGPSVVVDLLNRHSFGIGHMTGIRGIYGSELKSLRLYHVIPRIVGERSSLELFIEERYERFNESVDLNTTEAWAQLTFPLTARTHNRPYVRFQKPRVTLLAPDPEEVPEEQVASPLLGWQVAFDSVSRRIGEQRRRGVFVGIDLQGASEALGSDVTLIGAVGQVKYFLPLGRSETGRFTWAQFWRGGLREARDAEVPFVDRFRLGGEFSVRGYPTNSLGPQSEDGVPLGGEVLFIVNQEIHALLLRTERAGSVSALAFFDAGNVWANRDSVGGGLFKSVGVGTRYNSPVGPLRLDVGFPLDRRPDDPSYKIYLGFGSVF